MANKTNQMGVRLDDRQNEVLEEIAGKYHHTQAGLVRLAVDQMIHAYEKNGGELPGLPKDAVRKNSDVKEASAAAAGK